MVSPPTTCSPTGRRLRVGRQEDVHPRSEFHQTDALPALEHVSFATRQTMRRASSPTTCLNDHRPRPVIDPHFVQLVVVRAFVVGRKKLPGPIVDRGDAAVDRRPVDVNVHRRQEDRDLLPVARRRPAGVRGAGDITRPSAGDTTASAACGTWRSGSRKKKVKNPPSTAREAAPPGGARPRRQRPARVRPR